jgi:hypothetical protein
MAGTLVSRAKFYRRVAKHLYGKQGIRGKVVLASRGARHLTLGIRLADPFQLDAALKLAEPMALATNTTAIIAQRLPELPGLVSYQFQLQPGLWQYYTRADVTGLGVGLGESRRQIDFGFDPPHALIAGTTDSGKTETAKSILTGLATEFTPDDLQMVIIDPHRDYDAFGNVAHLATPVARTNEEIERAIMWVAQELAHRKDNNERGAKRTVVVVEEAENTLSGDRLAVIQRVGAEARKFNMNLIVSTQKPQQKNLPDLVDKLNNRWVGLVDNAHTSALLTGQSGLQCHKLTGKGDFVHVAGATQERLQVALATDEDLARLPRAEIQEPEIVEEDTTRILNYPVEEDRGPGRPSTEIDPRKVAWYYWYGPDKITISQAEKLLELKRYAHYMHRDFAKEFVDEVKKLMQKGRK